jgi:hypothetical protein
VRKPTLYCYHTSVKKELNEHGKDAYDAIEQGMKDMKIPLILQDNMSTISLVTKGGGKPRTKYLRVRQHLIKERVSGKEISIVYTPTTRMLADTMTKPVQGELFRWMIGRIMGDATVPPAMVDRGALSGTTLPCKRVR